MGIGVDILVGVCDLVLFGSHLLFVLEREILDFLKVYSPEKEN